MGKKSIITFILFATSFSLCAQEEAKNSALLNDSLVARFNRKDFRSMWLLGSDDWKKKNPSPGDFAAYMRWLDNKSGSITASSPSGRRANTVSFLWTGSRKTLIMELRDPSSQGYNDINFSVYVSDNQLSAVGTDNVLKNAIDSAVDGLVRRYMVENSIVGMSIGITINNRPYTYNYGSVERGKIQLPTDRTLYDLGSIGKTITATLLAHAILDKKVLPDDDIRKYLPGRYPNLEYRGNPIRLVHLANYTSGLPSDIPHDLRNFSPGEVLHFYNTYTVAEFFNDFHTVRLDTIPGTRYLYSSSAVALLAAILERVYHKSYAELVQKFVSNPMNMDDTRVNMEGEKDSGKFARGYTVDGIVTHWTFGPTRSLGGVHSSVHDMLLFLQQNIIEQDPAVRLSHQQTTQLGIPGDESGLGWFIEPTARGIQIEKGGNSPRHSSDCVIIREKKMGVVCLANEAGLELRDLSESILDKLMSAF